MSRSSPILVTFSRALIGRFKCQALVLLVPANFQAPRPASVTLFPTLSGSRIFCSCPAGVCLECQARVRLLSGLTFSYGNSLSGSPKIWPIKMEFVLCLHEKMIQHLLGPK